MGYSSFDDLANRARKKWVRNTREAITDEAADKWLRRWVESMFE